MRNLTPTAHTAASILTCLPVVMLIAGAALTTSAQQALTQRVLYVTVSDPQNRFVTGLDAETFEVFEKGYPRPITGFSSSGNAPMSIAIVSDTPLPPLDVSGDLIRTTSVLDALHQLAASKNQRKAIVIVGAANAQPIPDDIQVLQANSGTWQKVVVEIRNQYVVRFGSPAPSTSIDVVLRQPRGLPLLKAHWM
jgi:hypothetical protein